MEHVPPEAEGVLPHHGQVDELEHRELVEEDAGDDGDDEERELRHKEAELGDAEDLGADDGADAHGGDPHDAVDHAHDDLVHHREESNHGLARRAQGAQDGAEGQAEEDDAEGVGAGAVGQDALDVLLLGGVGSGGGVFLGFVSGVGLRGDCEDTLH